MAKNLSFQLDRFLGLHLPGSGCEKLKDGESPDLVNFKVTPGYHLARRDGFSVLQRGLGRVRALWQGTLTDSRFYLAVLGGSLYRSEDAFETIRKVGDIPGENDVFLFEFCETLYLLTGTNIYVYNGSALSELEPYRPLVRIGTPPSGGGTVFEDANFLTGKMRQTFTPSENATMYYLALQDLVSIDYITVNGRPVSVDDTASNLWGGTIELLNPPPEGVPDSVEIGFTAHRSPEAMQKILHCRRAISYGGGNDSRVFLYGNPSHPAMRFYSGLVDGLPSMNYFPEHNFSRVGDGEVITDIIHHYDRQILFSPHATYYSYAESATDENGRAFLSFPVYPLSAMKGSIATGAATLIDNKPMSVMPDGLYVWTNTSIRDERNANCFTSRIAEAFQTFSPAQSVFFHRTATNELFFTAGDLLYVYNYALDVFYRYRGVIPCVFAEDDLGAFFFGCDDGRLCRAGGNTDDGDTIIAHVALGPLDFGDRSHTKNLLAVSCDMAPHLDNRATLSIGTDRATQVRETELGARLCHFDDCDFSTFSFETGRTHGKNKKRLPAKRFSELRPFLRHARADAGIHLYGLRFFLTVNDQRN